MSMSSKSLDNDIVEDLPSNEELLALAAETKDEFYASMFAAIDEMYGNKQDGTSLSRKSS